MSVNFPALIPLVTESESREWISRETGVNGERTRLGELGEPPGLTVRSAPIRVGRVFVGVDEDDSDDFALEVPNPRVPSWHVSTHRYQLQIIYVGYE
jgi:hypothetical protein